MKGQKGKIYYGINYDDLVKQIYDFFNTIEDPRNRSIHYNFRDFLMSAFAMFALKYPSLLRFETQGGNEKANLKSLFRVSNLCSDAQMRKVLDKVDAAPLRKQFVNFYNQLKSGKMLNSYEVLGDYKICSVDGVQHFRSNQVHCEQCLETKHSDGTISYSHSMLGAVIVHPDQKEVFVIAAEPIINQDGNVKNDCELNAHKRLLSWMAKQYKGENFIMVEDALYANGPHIKEILANNWAYVINIKPNKHKALFEILETRQNQIKRKNTYTTSDAKRNVLTYQWSNELVFNNSHPDLLVNMIIVDEKNKRGRTRRFSYVTSIPITEHNVELIVKIGRSRWKIENETFNTLKNQGYHFEHNYGHGNEHLANTLSIIMLLAFTTDQILQHTNTLFNKIWKAAKTKAKIWDMLKASFMVKELSSFDKTYKFIASQFFVQLE